jgi:apolipoprotein N-acyltransferase
MLHRLINCWREPRPLHQWGAGLAAVLALPPFFIWPVLPFSLGMLWNGLHQAKTHKRRFWHGWWWGFGHFMGGLYWFSYALLTDPVQFGWLIPFALTLIPAALAVYVALTGVVAFWFRPRGMQAVLLFSTVWVLFEWLRGVLFTGFPWNLTGYVLNGTLASMQLASLGGVWLMGFVAVFLSLLPWLTVHEGGWRRFKGAVLSLVVLLILMAGGWGRLANHPAILDGPVVRVVQANIEQKLKWTPEVRTQSVFEQARMSRTGHGEPPSQIPQIVVWPETAVPYVWSERFFLRPVLDSAVPPGGGMLMTGMIRETGADIYNSLLVLTKGAALATSYDKRHLVPFGEFVPLRHILPLVAMVYGGRDFSHGGGDAVIALPGYPPVRPLICYEAIFPSDVWNGKNPRPEWLVNITNDAWFGISTGPYQHVEAARLRALEQGVPLVRAANTGISAVVDPLGRVIRLIPLGVKGTITTPMPRSLLPGFYASHPYIIINILAMVALGMQCYVWRRKSKTPYRSKN